MASHILQIGHSSPNQTHPTSQTILANSANWGSFKRDILSHFRTNFGQIGQDCINCDETPYEEAGPMPDYNDPRIHPQTKEPIPNSRKYLQRELTEAETQDQDFDPQTPELTAESGI